ncbi:MAG: hypothetical protein NC221_03540 [Duncaniella sp.]|nr:hypothetical protein [Muribaculum sp.]MCM1255175.1 hypothetical protein [Duncaniella sp.]
MKMLLTQSQMLTLWRQHRLLEPIRNDASVTHYDGIDLEAILLPEMELWYDKLLRDAPVELLVTHDISGKIVPKADEDGSLSVTLPDNVVRVINVKMSDWRKGTAPVMPDSIEALRQAHPFTRATIYDPIAILADGILRLYPAKVSDTLLQLDCIMRNEGEYEFMRQALATVQPIDNDIITHLSLT